MARSGSSRGLCWTSVSDPLRTLSHDRSVFPWNALSQREKVTGRAFDRQIGSTKRGDLYADCRITTGFAFDRHICYATVDRKWSSGESRIKVSAVGTKNYLEVLIAVLPLAPKRT